MPKGAHPSSQHRDAAVTIVRTLRDAGHEAYFAGGCVRDEVLRLAPKDYDVATDARPEQVKDLFRRSNEVGAAFGVMLVHLQGVTVEVATFRREGGYTDRRRPDHVEYAGRDEDAKRRDFTINALYLDPLAPPTDACPHVDGAVVDLVRGLADIDSKVIRAVGDPDDRLAEDDLRALRAVRFASRLGFMIEPATADAIRRHAGDLTGISRERIGDELRLMLTHPGRAEAVRLMGALGLVGPSLGTDQQDEPEPALLTGLTPDAGFATALAAWAIDRSGAYEPAGLRSLAAPVSKQFRTALCLSNDERDDVKESIETLAVLLDQWGSLAVARQKRLAVQRAFASAMAILAVLDGALHVSIAARVEDLRQTPSGLRPDPLLIGDDLIEMGLTPGPAFRSILDAVYDAQLEDEIADREAARSLARRVSGP